MQDAPANKDKENDKVKTCKGKYKNEGFIAVSLDTMSGLTIEVQARYYRRSCDKRNGKRYKGVYAGLILLGIHERCTPLLASTVSMWSSLLSSFAEVQQVLSEQGISFSIRVLRRICYRYADHPRLMQQAGEFTLSEGESVAGRYVVVSCDGGRIRLRENKRGKKTKKGRTRYKGAWREPCAIDNICC